MKTDTYTKVILTIIAIVLTVNLFKGFFVSPAQATASNDKRMITVPVNADGTIDVNIKSINSYSTAFQFSAPIPVVITK